MTDYVPTRLTALADRTVVVTGASSGIGAATVQAVAAAGARVVLAVRDPAKGRAVADRLPGAEVRALDLADLASVRRFAAEWDGPIHALVNNAGVSVPDLRRTADGFELTMGTNHLGHFALTLLLLPHIMDRVVTVASQAERGARLDLADLGWERRPFRGGRAYNDSKLANLLFTAELDRRLRASGSPVRALAVHPGLVVTPIYDAPEPRRRGIWDLLLPRLGQDAAAGALPTLYALTEDVPGGTFVGPQHLLHMRGGAEVIGRSAAAKDPALARRLWEASERLVGLPAAV